MLLEDTIHFGLSFSIYFFSLLLSSVNDKVLNWGKCKFISLVSYSIPYICTY